MKKGDIITKRNAPQKFLKVVDSTRKLVFFKELTNKKIKVVRIYGDNKEKYKVVPTIYLKIDEKTKLSIIDKIYKEQPVVFSHPISTSYEKLYEDECKIVCVMHIKSGFKLYFLLNDVEKTCKRISTVSNSPYEIRIRIKLGEMI